MSLVLIILYVVVFVYEVVCPSMLVRLIIKVGGVLWWLVFLQHFIAYRTLLPHMMEQHRASDEEIVLIFDTIGRDYNVT